MNFGPPARPIALICAATDVPTVSVVQREYSIVEGSPLSISCQVDANPPPNIVNWRLVTDSEYNTVYGLQQQQTAGRLLLLRPKGASR